MTIAITGSGGQLGFALVQQLGPQALGRDRAEFDLARPDGIEAALDRLRPRALINCAAYTLVDQAEEERDQCFAVNAQAVERLAECCSERGIKLVQISTDYVFGGDQTRTVPYRESDDPAPLNVYGQSKLAGEQAAARCGGHLIVRVSGVHGLSPRASRNFVSTMLRLARERDSLGVVADQHCTPSYAGDLAIGIARLIEVGARGVVHLTNAGATTWHGFACEIFQQLGLNMQVTAITSAEYPTPAQRPVYCVLDTTRFNELTGSEMPSWQAGIRAHLEQLQTGT